MKLLTIDFETFYGDDYTLSRMSTEDYVADPRFEVILVQAERANGTMEFCTGNHKEVAKFLHSLDIPNCGIVAHNAMFDALILQHQFNIRPGFIFDTLGMAQAHLKPFIPRISLAACLAYCNLGIQKGTYVANMRGRTRQSLSRAEMIEYANYCADDVVGTRLLFKHLLPLMPRSELVIIDQTLRMYLEPKLELDGGVLAEVLQHEQSTKAALLERVKSHLTKDDLMSNPKFATALERAGVDPPMKVSPTTGKLTYAFAKQDPEFKAFTEEHADNELVQALLAARLGVKSTIGETRTLRLQGIAARHRLLRVPLRYYAAHTGRYGGTEKINLQNPPRVEKSRMRFAIKAPKDHVLLGADLSQIEARMVAWWAGCKHLTEAFRAGADIYSEFATAATKTPTVKGRSKADDVRRFLGKTCILGLGFGMGAAKLQNTINVSGKIKVGLDETQTYVQTYRGMYYQIPILWQRLDQVINVMAAGNARGEIGPVRFGKQIVHLPNDMPIYYNNLHRDQTNEWTYTYGHESRKLFGGKLCENIVQAMARIVVMEHMATIKRELGLSMTMQVHDELDYVVPEARAEEYAAAITSIMSTPPTWAPDLPVAVEVNWGPTFGDCK